MARIKRICLNAIGKDIAFISSVEDIILFPVFKKNIPKSNNAPSGTRNRPTVGGIQISTKYGDDSEIPPENNNYH